MPGNLIILRQRIISAHLLCSSISTSVVFVIHCCYVCYILPAKQEAGSADLLKVTNISFCWVHDGIGAVKGCARLMEPKQQSRSFCWLVKSMLASGFCMPQCCEHGSHTVDLPTVCCSCVSDRLSPLQRSSKQGNKSACCTGCQMGSTLKTLGGSLCFCPGNAASMGNAQCTECCCKAYNSFKIPTAASTDSTPCQAECLGAPLSLLSTDLLLHHHSTVICQVIILTCTDVGMIWLQSCCSAVAVALAVTVSVTITASVTVSVADQVYITLMGDVQMTLVMH